MTQVSAEHIAQLRRRQRRIQRSTIAVLVLLIVTLMVVSMMLGQYAISPAEVWTILLHGPGGEGMAPSIVWMVRLPRLLMALVVGMALGVGGALMQALFANPLAEPGIIGVSAGAAVGAACAITVSATVLGGLTVPAAAFLGGLITTLLVVRLARVRGRTPAVALVLVGVAVNAVCGAFSSFIVYMASTTARDQIVFWQMGSLNGSQWHQVMLTAPLVLIGIIGALLLAPGLNVLALGERAAMHSGVDVTALRRWSVVVTALLTAAAVSFSGIISFVGLIVPHLLRLIVGPNNRILVPVSALGGGVLVIGADLAARTLLPFTDLPIGMFTALVGGPTFFVLLRRTLMKGGLQ